MMICKANWITCDGAPTNHDDTQVVEAVAVMVIRVGNKEKRVPVCKEHLTTLVAKRLHHDPNCEHDSQCYMNWTIEKLEEQNETVNAAL